MKLSPHYLKRYKDILLLYLKYFPPGALSRFDREPAEGRGATNGTPDVVGLPDDLEQLGPTFIKLGQLLSSRPDLVPDAHRQVLSRLQDRVKPFPFQEVQLIIENELGTKISKAFSTFEVDPIAAASLGQVHRAALRDGTPVVVKIQRPKIAPQIEEDFAALAEVARFLQRHTEFGQHYEILKVIEEYETTLIQELDYKREAANMVLLQQNLSEFPRLKVPLPVIGFATHKVLTMEYVEGVKITELSPLARLDMDGDALAEELFRAYLKQVLVDGMFHADPHPGNIFFTPDRRIALLDLGMVGHLTPAMQENLLKLLLAVSEGEGDEAADIAIRIGETSDDFREMDFRHYIGQTVAKQRNTTLRAMDIGKTILQVSRTAGDTGLHVPSELAVLGKTLLQLDQVGAILAPGFDANESIRRNASQILNQRLKTVFTEGKLFSSLLEAKQFIGALPLRAGKILDAIGNAELKVKVKPAETQLLLESFQKIANRITAGLIFASLIVGAALLMRVQTSFQIMGYPGFAILCFLAAVGGGACLVGNILWQDHKSKYKARRK